MYIKLYVIHKALWELYHNGRVIDLDNIDYESDEILDTIDGFDMSTQIESFLKRYITSS